MSSGSGPPNKCLTQTLLNFGYSSLKYNQSKQAGRPSRVGYSEADLGPNTYLHNSVPDSLMSAPWYGKRRNKAIEKKTLKARMNGQLTMFNTSHSLYGKAW